MREAEELEFLFVVRAVQIQIARGAVVVVVVSEPAVVVFQHALLPEPPEEGRGESVLRRRWLETVAAPPLRSGDVAGESFGLRRRRRGGLLRLLAGGVEADAAEGDPAGPARRALAQRVRVEVLLEPVGASEPYPAVEPEGDNNAAGGGGSRRC